MIICCSYDSDNFLQHFLIWQKQLQQHNNNNSTPQHVGVKYKIHFTPFNSFSNNNPKKHNYPFFTNPIQVGVAVIIQVSKFFMLVYVCLHQFDKSVVIMQYKRQQALYCKGETSWLIRVCKKNKIKKTQRTKPVSWSLFVENQFSFFLALKPMRSSLVTKKFGFKMIKPVLFTNHYKIMYLALFRCKNKLSIDILFDLMIFYSNWKLGVLSNV